MGVHVNACFQSVNGNMLLFVNSLVLKYTRVSLILMIQMFKSCYQFVLMMIHDLITVPKSCGKYYNLLYKYI